MTDTVPADDDRFGWLEYPNDDFPYYDGEPVTISVGQWLFVLAAVALGFACLIAPIPLLAGNVGGFVRAILFAAVPLAALRIVAGPHWTAIFRRIRGRDIMWMFVFGILNLIVTLGVGLLATKMFEVVANPAVHSLGEASTSGRVLFFLKTIPQLFGEEVLTILPLLAFLYFGHAKLGWSRKSSIFWAWIASSVIFALVHLPSYSWNILQCLVVIGSARLILSLAYLKTKNIWVSTGAHILNDWLIFGTTILGAGAAAAA